MEAFLLIGRNDPVGLGLGETAMILLWGALALFLQSCLSLPLTLLVMIPGIVWTIFRSSFTQTLYFAFLSGLLVDLLSASPLGIHSLNYLLIAALFFRYRSFFSIEVSWHLPMVSSFFSLLSTLLLGFFLFLFDKRIPFQGQWFLIDSILMPLLDGTFAFFWIMVPRKLYLLWRPRWIRFRTKLSLKLP